MKKSPRIRRLEADLRGIQRLAAESSIFDFEAPGVLPEAYRFFFHGPGTYKTSRNTVAIRGEHEVIVELGAAYPRLIPGIAWQSPIFHPNVSTGGVVCLGAYGTNWVPSLRLDEMCVMLWDMIRYRNYDVESPYNREAALWARQQSDFRFPLDDRPLRDRVNESPTQWASANASAKPPVMVEVPPNSADPVRVTENTSSPTVSDEIVFLD